MKVFGSGKFKYRVVDNWARRPKMWAFTDVPSVAVDSKDRVYVFTRTVHPVIIFDKDGKFIRSWGEGILRPHGAYITPNDEIWCVDDLDQTVRKFDVNGNVLMTIGTSGIRSDTGYDGKRYMSVKRSGPPFNRPTKLCIAPSGDMYVTDGYGNSRVHKFSPDGKLLLSWGEPGDGPSQFHIPHSLVIDKQGKVYVADRENSRIQVFSPDGALLTIWPNIARPNDMHLDAEGNLFVTNGKLDKNPDFVKSGKEPRAGMSIFNLEGKRIGGWGDEEGEEMDAGHFIAPHGMTVDSRGVVYVSEASESAWGIDRGVRAVQKFVPTT